MSLAIASGKNFAGFKIEQPSRVLHLSAEGGYFPTRKRIQVMAEEEEEDILKNIFFLKYVVQGYLTDPDKTGLGCVQTNVWCTTHE